MYASSHVNITSKHKNTLEFTTEDYVTKKGDCIVAINFNFNKEELQKVLTYKKIKITIKAGNIEENIFAYPNKKFSNFKEFVIRKSDFLCSRTFAIKSNKSADDLNEELKKELKKQSNKISISIEPVKIKAIIFDFEDTLEKWKKPEAFVEKKIVSIISKKYNIDKDLVFSKYYKVRNSFVENPLKPIHLDRTTWYLKLFKELNINISKKEISSIVGLYWELSLKKVTLFPEVFNILEQLKQKYKLAILSNSDGKKKIKLNRIKHLKVDKYFNYIFTTDDIGFNKPDKRNFIYAAKKLKVKPEECIMVGDNLKFDLMNSKSLGMTTILIHRYKQVLNKKTSFADFELTSLKKIPKIIQNLNK